MKNLVHFLLVSAALLLISAIIAPLLTTNWFSVVKVVFYLEILYFLASLKSVGAKELGAILIFGKPVEEVGPGLSFLPLGISSLVKETALTVQDQYPAEPELVDKTPSDTLAPGKVFPMRATHAAPKTKTDDAINIRMTSEVSAVARFQVKKGEYLTFLTTIGSMRELKRTIKDTVEGGIKTEFAKRTPSETLGALEEINGILKDAVTKLTETWGVAIVDVQIVDVDLGRTVNQALRDVPASILAKQKAVEDAESEKVKILRKGEADADAKQRMLTAEAEGMRLLLEAKAIGAEKLAKVAGTPEGQVTLWLDTMRIGFEKSNHTIIPGGELFSAMSGVAALLDKVKEKK